MNKKIIKQKYFIIILILLFVTSCQNKNNQEAIDLKTEKKKDIINKINATHEGIVCLDTIDTYRNFSIDLQEKYCGNPILIDDFFIVDIYKVNEKYHAVLELFPSFIYVDLMLSQEEYEILKRAGRVQTVTDLVIVAVLDDIRKMKFEIEALEYDEMAYIEINSSLNFIAKGNIMNIKIIN